MAIVYVAKRVYICIRKMRTWKAIKTNMFGAITFQTTPKPEPTNRNPKHKTTKRTYKPKPCKTKFA